MSAESEKVLAGEIHDHKHKGQFLPMTTVSRGAHRICFPFIVFECFGAADSRRAWSLVCGRDCDSTKITLSSLGDSKVLLEMAAVRHTGPVVAMRSNLDFE